MQKKIWWCCAVSAAVAVFAFNLAADHAARHPESFVGTCLIKAYHKNNSVMYARGKPFREAREAGLIARDTLSALNMKDQKGTANTNNGATVSCVPEPTPVPKSPCATNETPDRLPGCIEFNTQHLTPIVEQPIEVPTKDDSQPTVNPPGIVLPASDSTDPEQVRMPYADEEESLPAEGTNVPNCREDPNRDSQYPGCPTTETCPCPYQQCQPKHVVPANGMEMEDAADDSRWLPPDDFAKNLERVQRLRETKSQQNYSWLTRIRKRLMESTIMRRDVDTMEFRPSDALPNQFDPIPY